MPRRRRQKPPRAEPRPGPFHAPFRTLGRQVRPATTERVVQAPPVAPRRQAGTPAEGDRADENDQVSFLRAMADVRRLPPAARVDAPPPALQTERIPIDEEGEALAALSDLVSTGRGFDISDSTEYVEGAVVGLDPRILRRLRRGEFPYQEILDLHGLTATAARTEVGTFISRALAEGRRSVLIVHGRGRNSRGQVPVLKERLKGWLAHGRVGRSLLAFTSARPADGGTGAVYVLLRRRRGSKEPIRVYDGAKHE